jgi:hypothetical protein
MLGAQMAREGTILVNHRAKSLLYTARRVFFQKESGCLFRKGLTSRFFCAKIGEKL